MNDINSFLAFFSTIREATIPKGAAMKKINMELIKKTLLDKGYIVKE